MIIKGSYKGISVEEILPHLSDDGKHTFQEVVQKIIDDPNSITRNAEYAELLDSLNSNIEIPIFRAYDWREDNIVVLENANEDAIDEILRIMLYISKRGKGGFSEEGPFITGFDHFETEKGKTYDILKVGAYIDKNGKIYVESPEERERIREALLQEGEYV